MLLFLQKKPKIIVLNSEFVSIIEMEKLLEIINSI